MATPAARAPAAAYSRDQELVRIRSKGPDPAAERTSRAGTEPYLELIALDRDLMKAVKMDPASRRIGVVQYDESLVPDLRQPFRLDEVIAEINSLCFSL